MILVDGALCYRGSGPAKPLAALLKSHFTVFTYDRRGRGESTDTAPYRIDREVEDLAAVVREAGGSAYVYGISSGAALALEAAARGVGILKLVLYEAPFIVDTTHSPLPEDYLTHLKKLIAADRRSGAVKFFMRRVGVPWFIVVFMTFMPFWRKLKAIAHTLVYDITIVQDHSRGKPLSQTQWSSVTIPVLVADGGKSPTWIRNSMRQLARVLPNASYRTLAGQTQMLKADVIAPVLKEFCVDGVGGKL